MLHAVQYSSSDLGSAIAILLLRVCTPVEQEARRRARLHEYMKEGRIGSSTSLLHTKGIILIIILQLFIIIIL